MVHKVVLSCLLLALALPGWAKEITIDPIPQEVLLQYLAGKEVFELIDARSEQEYEAGHIYGALNVPHDADLSKVDALPSELDAPLVVYCKSGLRAVKLQERMEAQGYTNVRVLAPGQMMWSDSLPVFNCGAEAPKPQVLKTADSEMP